MKIINKFKILLIVLTSLLTLSGCSSNKNDDTTYHTTIEELKGKTLSLVTDNNIYAPMIEEEIPDIKIDYYQNYTDTFLATSNGKSDFSFTSYSLFPGIEKNIDNLAIIKSSIEVPIVMAFSYKADPIKQEFNEYIKKAKEDGTIDSLAAHWIDDYGNHSDYIDFNTLTGTKGTITLACAFDNIPIEYLQDGNFAGFEVALFYDFCQEYGYQVKVEMVEYVAALTGTTTGKYDASIGFYGYTEERSESTNFSDPYFTDYFGYVVRKQTNNSKTFIDSIIDSFYRNFIKENRYQLLIGGFKETLKISLFSLVLGTLFGFLLFLLSYQKKFLPNLLTKTNNILEALPVLVILMIFYYGIFGSSEISGSSVSIIVFSLLFGLSFYNLINNCVISIPKVYDEAALALGYTKYQSLFKVILPQIRTSFIPTYNSSIIALLKNTSIVGYVAVQDLTKAGDLIRGYTYEAFMPLIAVAIVYFILSKIVIALLGVMFKLTSPDKGKRFLKEVDDANTKC